MKRMHLFTILCILTVLGALLLIWRGSLKTAPLPKPTGPYAVGVTTLHLIDKNRHELRSSKPHDFRELMLYIWYPASPEGTEQIAFYAPGPMAAIMKKDFNQFVGTPLNQLSLLDTLKTYSFINAPLSTKEQKYPLLLFSPGVGSPVQLYTTLLEDLASHGYIVAAINHPYLSNPTIFPDGRIIMRYEQKPKPSAQEIESSRRQNTQTWIADTRFALDELLRNPPALLKNKINPEEVGVFGHSFGGSIAIEVCGLDNRCKAGVDIDGKLAFESRFPNGYKKPFMFILGEHSEVPEIKSLEKLAAHMGKDAYLVTVSGASHGSFGDYMLIAPPKNAPSLNPQKALVITRSLLVNFFDHYLKNKTTGMLTLPPYPEVKTHENLSKF